MSHWAEKKTVHRRLHVQHGDLLRGADVRELQTVVDWRLRSRGAGAREAGADDGVYGHQTAKAAGSALLLMGAPSHVARRVTDGGNLGEAGQRFLKHPGRRTHAQVVRARQEMRHVRKWRSHHHHRYEHGQAVEIVHQALQAADLAYHHRGRVHYTQGPQRWQGIDHKLRWERGQYPTEADCSAFYSWVYWSAMRNVLGAEFPDVLNGEDWTGGFTGSLLKHGTRHMHPVLGCAVIYGTGWPGEHVAIYAGHGMVYSHGSEAGPFYLDYRYRSDILQFRSYV